MTERYVGAIDQGTTSSRFIVFDHDGRIVGSAQEEHQQLLPKPGWVEHDAIEIRARVEQVIGEGLEAAGITGDQLDAVGITNQRETTLVWDAATGDPVANAIVW